MLDLSTFRSLRKERKGEMTRKQNNAGKPDWKEVLAEQEDFLRPLIQEVVQQVLEAEMEEALRSWEGGADGKSSRLPFRLLRTVSDHACGLAGVARSAGPAGTISNRDL